MTDQTCPVRKTVIYLSKQIGSGVLTEPRIRRIFEQILSLTEEIAGGAAGSEHLAAIDSLIEEFDDGIVFAEDLQIADVLKRTLKDHREVFQSHIETRNCSSHDCVKLAPSPCQMACPAGIDVPAYLSLIAQGDDAGAIEVIRRDNPLPWICGLVCTRPCETVCVRGRIDTPVSIKNLKAFAAERAMSEGAYKNPEPLPLNGKKVCVIGAGPGGLSAAYYLALMGYGVKVIEDLPVAGGMLMVGIPRYRLPKEVIDREVAMIRALGVEFSFNTRFGRDVTLEELKKEEYQAFFIAIGSHKSFNLGIKGEKDFPKVLDAVKFLKDVALGDRDVPGENVVVIGGGNVAIDAARTSLRLGARKVTIAYRRSGEQMPADIEEIKQAAEEGVQFSFLTIPKEISGSEGTIQSLDCIQAELIQKKGSDRLSPVPIPGKDFSIKADAIIIAIGQYVDHVGMEDFNQMKWSRRGTIEVNHSSMRTAMPGVFAAGDAVSGPATVIEAIGGGKRAAEAIDRYLNRIPEPIMPKVPVRHTIEPQIELSAEKKMALKRPDMPMCNMVMRLTTFQQAELGYDEESVRMEAARCLRCDICRRCGKCVDVCRDKMGIDALRLGYLEFDNLSETDFRATAEKCIVCGACAANCENSAMLVEEKDGERLLKICGTILNRQTVQYCEECNATLPSTEYMQFVSSKTGDFPHVTGERLLCDDCRRLLTAKSFAKTLPVGFE